MDGADKQCILSRVEIGDCEHLNEWPRLPCPLGKELQLDISRQHAFATTLVYLFVHCVCLCSDFDILLGQGWWWWGGDKSLLLSFMEH